MASHRDLGGGECDDVVAGLDHLIELGLTDPDRAAIVGWSHGGFHAAWGATYASKRFRAAVVGAGITNWISYAGTAEGALEEQLCHWDVPLYEAFSLYLERSPITHVANAQTPTLILHGTEDPWVPVGQAQELYRALRWRGVPVELVLYPGEGHSIDLRENQLDRLQRVLGWLDRWLA
jgi:dipeptidyl aminopeptidase/acylaminoacyl peptidase